MTPGNYIRKYHTGGIPAFFIYCCFFLLSFSGNAQTTDPVIFDDNFKGDYISDRLYYLEDTSNKLSVYDVQHRPFLHSTSQVLNLDVKPSTYWFKITIRNISSHKQFILLLDNPMLTNVGLYRPADSSGQVFLEEHVTKYEPFHARENHNPSPEFHITQAIGTTATYYIKVSSLTQLLIPLKIGSTDTMGFDNTGKNLWYGFYFGIMLVMFFYNLFIYLSIKDKSYLYYIFYILSVTLVQLNTTGLGFKYLWSDFPDFEIYNTYIFSALTAFASIAFVKKFLHTKHYTPRADKFFWVFVVAYLFTILNVFIGDKHLSYNLLNVNALPLSLFLIGNAAYIRYKYKYRPAIFFLISWSIFLLGIIFYVLKDYSIVPYNLYTASSVQIGSAIEIILLSFALADRINILERQNRESRENALRATQETARLIREQNIILEQKVKERTEELERSNEDLETALKELKEAEAHLVESEKMASLGQLTAGIAHEINNPINFVTSNVNPLKRDVHILTGMIGFLEEIISSDAEPEIKKQQIQERKEEIDYDYLCTEIEYLLNGIGEGASRTAEIVKGLRVFSRLDEDDLKQASINQGLDSTLVIINHQLTDFIKIIKEYRDIPMVECYPGKLNQVFLNILSNAVHAIEVRWGKNPGGELKITTRSDGNNAYISIEDNGTGMSEETQRKMFEPFFTTKEVGEGTGLGMSIAYNTIKKHNGSIEVKSAVGVGTVFTIMIPLTHVITESVA